MRLKYEKVIHHAIVNNLFGFGYTKKSCNAQGSSKYYLFVTAPFLICFSYPVNPTTLPSLFQNKFCVDLFFLVH